MEEEEEAAAGARPVGASGGRRRKEAKRDDTITERERESCMGDRKRQRDREGHQRWH